MNKIRTRLNLLVLVLIACIFAVVFFFTQDLQGDTLHGTQEVTEGIIQYTLRDEWYKKIRSLANIYAYQLTQPVYTKNLETIRILSMAAVQQDLVNAILVMDDTGMILSDGTAESRLLGRQYSDSLLPAGENTVVRTDIQVGNHTMGEVILAFDSTETEKAITSLYAQVTALFHAKLAGSRRELILIFLISLGLGSAATWLISRGFTRPLGVLSTAIERIGRNEYDIAVPEKRSDEIGELSRTLKRVALSLRDTTVSKTYLETILSSLPVGVAVTDGSGIILTANPSFQMLCGASSAKVTGTPFHSAVGLDPAVFGPMLQHLKEAQPVREQDGVFRRNDGTSVEALLSALPLPEDGPSETESYLFIIYDITERKGLERKLEHIATHDHLTGLPNRRHILSRIEAEMERYRCDTEHPFWLIFVDLDRFKDANDTYGHHVGDEILKQTARRMEEVLRKGDIVARLGGDEFLVFLPQALSPDQAVTISNRLLDMLRLPFHIGDIVISISASVGLTRSDPKHRSTDDIMVEADTAMYEAKETGKNKVITVFDLNDTTRRDRLLLEKDIRSALSEDQFVNYYQPIVEPQTGRIIGFEALSRWIHPEKGVLLPASFIPAAENSGLILDLGETVFRSACLQWGDWADRYGLTEGYISVNISSQQIYDPSFPEAVGNILEETGADPARIVLELTESLIMLDPDIAVVIMERLRDMGLRLAIDDFGTGYSSLSYLHRFPFDILKVDRTFISGIDRSPKQTAMLRIICDIGRNLNMEIVLEGIETPEQVQLIQPFGISKCQGFFYSHPLPAPDLERRFIAREDGIGLQILKP